MLYLVRQLRELARIYQQSVAENAQTRAGRCD
jgi:hypothetical protein